MYPIEFEYSTHAGQKVPIIPVGIKGKDKWYELWAFVDTGATYSVFEVFKVCFDDRKKLYHF